MRRPRCLLLPLLGLLASGAAEAHGTAKGLGSFFGGVVHPLVEPAHLLTIVALGLYVGQRSLTGTHPASVWFAASLAIALALAFVGVGSGVDTEQWLLALAAVIGLSVAVSARWPRWLGCVLAGAAGLGIGLGSRPDGGTGAEMAATLLGVGVGGPTWVINVALLVEALKRPWLKVLVRVVGSWATASCVLVLALWFAQKPAIEREAAPGERVLPAELRR